MERKRRMMTAQAVLLGIALAAVAAAVMLALADPGYRPAARFRDDTPLEQRLNTWLHGRPGILHSDAPATVTDILHRTPPTPVARAPDGPPPPPPHP